MRHCQRLLLSTLILAFTNSVFAEEIRVKSARYEQGGSRSKIIFDLSGSAKGRAFVLEKPSRLIVDIKQAEAKSLPQPPANHPLFSRLRTLAKNDADLRVVVDLKDQVSGKTHKLSVSNPDSQHFVVQVIGKSTEKTTNVEKKTSDAPLAKALGKSEGDNKAVKASSHKNKANKSNKTFVVAIDAGHGGDDPGANGQNGTLEKHVTLSIAKRLQGLISGQSGMKAVLIRKGDYYVGLRERLKLARRVNADLFVSIHADACDNPEVKGASVYTLSRSGASSEAARWLANSENSKEKVNGVKLDDKDDVLASVLLDLSQTATQRDSLTLADKVLQNFKNIGNLHYNTVQNAGFVVLKSPDIPSILVETAYISNPSDELNLLSPRYQTKMANAIFKGILNFVNQKEPNEVNRMAKL